MKRNRSVSPGITVFFFVLLLLMTIILLVGLLSLYKECRKRTVCTERTIGWVIHSHVEYDENVSDRSGSPKQYTYYSVTYYPRNTKNTGSGSVPPLDYGFPDVNSASNDYRITFRQPGVNSIHQCNVFYNPDNPSESYVKDYFEPPSEAVMLPGAIGFLMLFSFLIYGYFARIRPIIALKKRRAALDKEEGPQALS